MAPTFDADRGESGFRALWVSGRDLSTAAAARNRLQRDLDVAREEQAAAAARCGGLQSSLDAAQDAYSAAHGRAVETGWSPTELLEVGLPAPVRAP